MSRVELWTTPVTIKDTPIKNEPVENAPVEKQYVITAGTNKFGKQLYLAGYKDCNDFIISQVPSKQSREESERLIKRATKKIEQNILDNKFTWINSVSNKKTLPDFNIVLYREQQKDEQH